MSKKKIVILIAAFVIVFTSVMSCIFTYGWHKINVNAEDVDYISIYIEQQSGGLILYRLPEQYNNEFIKKLNEIKIKRYPIKSAFAQENSSDYVMLLYKNDKIEQYKRCLYYNYYDNGLIKNYYPYDIETDKYMALLEEYSQYCEPIDLR